MSNKQYHIALSYASEQREYVSEVAGVLKSRNVRCFYDKDEEISLWGKNLLVEFQKVFESGLSHLVVIFISKEYLSKTFARAEGEYALAKNFEQKQEYILPVRFDSSTLPGLPSITKYIDIKNMSSEELAEKIIKKITDMGIYFGPDTPNPVVLNKVAQSNRLKTKLTIKHATVNPLSGAVVCLVHQNGTHLLKTSNENGEVEFPVVQHSQGFFTIFIAHCKFPATIIDNFECNNDCEVLLKTKSGVGSIIFDKGTGYIPGIKGRLSPILDSYSRTYLYADNISVNDGSNQPAHFQFRKNISLQDCSGKTADIRIIRIIQSCSILDYITY